MSQAIIYQLAFIAALALLVAFFAVGYVWLMRLFRRRRAPLPVTLTQRWLVAFSSILPLCIFAAYALFHAQSDVAFDSIGFGVLGAALAATSGVSLSAATRGDPAAEQADTDEAETFSVAQLLGARQRPSSRERR